METKNEPSEESIHLAAQCWCDPEASHIEMNTALAKVFAKTIDKIRAEYEPDPKFVQVPKIHDHAMNVMEYFLKLKMNLTMTPEESLESVKTVAFMLRLAVKRRAELAVEEGRASLAEETEKPKSKLILDSNGH